MNKLLTDIASTASPIRMAFISCDSSPVVAVVAAVRPVQ